MFNSLPYIWNFFGIIMKPFMTNPLFDFPSFLLNFYSKKIYFFIKKNVLLFIPPPRILRTQYHQISTEYFHNLIFSFGFSKK